MAGKNRRAMSDADQEAATLDWQIAVFCQNEAGRIAANLASIDAAIGGRRAIITVLINGSTDNSEAAALAAARRMATPVEVFRIAAADKSNAINCFLLDRGVRKEAGLYFCIDGYVTIGRDALRATEARLAACPNAVAATGIAINGRSERHTAAATVQAGGIMHGQFYALRPAFVRRIAQAGFALPLGLYRGDGLLGSMAAHDLDPVGNSWSNARLVGVADATFEIDALSPFRWRDLRRQFRRKIRQMRGRLENAAIKHLIASGGYASLPNHADDMIRDYLQQHPVPAVALVERPFMAMALRQHRKAAPAKAADLQPVRVA